MTASTEDFQNEVEEFGLLATRERLAARLPETPTEDDEIALAIEMLSDASEEARTHGNPNWEIHTVPAGVVNIVLRAAARGYMNPAGYEEEVADSVRLRRGDDYVKGAEFTDSEVRRVRALANSRGVFYSQSTRTTAWEARSDTPGDNTIYVPISNGHGNWRAFPFLSVDEHGRVS